MSLGNGPRKKFKNPRQTRGKTFVLRWEIYEGADTILDRLESGDKLDDWYMKKIKYIHTHIWLG